MDLYMSKQQESWSNLSVWALGQTSVYLLPQETKRGSAY
jgi:hypothetical protein